VARADPVGSRGKFGTAAFRTFCLGGTGFEQSLKNFAAFVAFVVENRHNFFPVVSK
jgi:hypothetical protein